MREAIDSLLAQTFSDFELIISDNASTDSTQLICEEYAQRDKRIRYIRQPHNMGASWNFQYVLSQATEKYFMWAAADDTWAPNWLDVLTKLIDEEDISVRGSIFFYHHDRVIYSSTPKCFKKNSLANFFIRQESAKEARHFYIYGLFNRQKLLSVDTSCLSFSWHPDYLYVYEMLKTGRMRATQDTYQIYRMNPNGEGTKLANNRNKFKRFIYQVHPWGYYSRYIQQTPYPLRFLIILLTPLKHVNNQIGLWIRVTPGLITTALRRMSVLQTPNQ